MLAVRGPTDPPSADKDPPSTVVMVVVVVVSHLASHLLLQVVEGEARVTGV